MTLFNWGENPRGIWKLVIEANEDIQKSNGKLQSFSLIFFGMKLNEKRSINERYKDYKHKTFFPDKETIQKIYQRELVQSRKTKIKRNKI